MLKKLVTRPLVKFLLLTSILIFATSVNVSAQDELTVNDETEQFFEEPTTTPTAVISPDSILRAEFKAVIKPPKSGKEVELGLTFFLSLILDLLMVFLIIRTIYYPNYRKLDTTFTFVMFNVSIFLLTFLLNQIKISMGAAFGLFAVFTMLRYRTAGISIKDMTYLFIFIATGLLSGVRLQIYELLIIYAIIYIMLFVMDSRFLIKRESTKTVYFDDIDLIHADKEKELIEELKKRTGLNIHRVSIDEISYLRDSANITIYYYSE